MMPVLFALPRQDLVGTSEEAPGLALVLVEVDLHRRRVELAARLERVVLRQARERLQAVEVVRDRLAGRLAGLERRDVHLGDVPRLGRIDAGPGPELGRVVLDAGLGLGVRAARA